ncbi:cytochrome P450 10-like [Lineus longissimus]|uniref:cytochrome P450 10-like n=1 Tax=Lineus longissimus TaxID=88925 RepID=UPI00315C711C
MDAAQYQYRKSVLAGLLILLNSNRQVLQLPFTPYLLTRSLSFTGLTTTKRDLSTSGGKGQRSVTLEDVKALPAGVPIIVPGRVRNNLVEPIPFSQIPGPKGWPVIGTLFEYFKPGGFRFNKMFEAYEARAKEYGPIYREQIGPIVTVVISDPEEYNKVLRNESKYPHRIELEPLKYYRRSHGMGLGVVNSQGLDWYKQRTILSKKMLRPPEVILFCDHMDEVADDFLNRLSAVRAKDGSMPDMEHEIFKWAFESIGTFLFEDRIGCYDTPPSELANQFIINLLGFFKLMQPLMYNMPFYKIYPTKKWREFSTYFGKLIDIGQELVDKKYDRLINNKNPSDERTGFLEYILSQKELTRREANLSAIEMMTGGVETTSNSVLWTLLCLAQNPRVQDRLYRESQAVLKGGSHIDSKNIQQMNYVKACLKEALRLYPITFATSRILHENLEVGGYDIPAGVQVQANLYCMGRDPEIFPSPLEYRPERWMKEGAKDCKAPALSNLVWGHGARMCLGRRLAEQEMYILITKLNQKFRLEYHGEPPEPVLNTVMTPDRPLNLKFIPRQ